MNWISYAERKPEPEPKRQVWALAFLASGIVLTALAQDKVTNKMVLYSKMPSTNGAITVENLRGRLLFRLGDGTPILEITPNDLNQVSNWVRVNWIDTAKERP